MITLITGVAGFIGYHCAAELLKAGSCVIGLDNLNDYYDVDLKRARLERLHSSANQNNATFKFYQVSLENINELNSVFSRHAINNVINLAAQAGVRYSLTNPSAYIQSNLVGFANILELCREHRIAHLVYASSSSVYGGNELLPFSENHPVNHPVSLYAATKKSNELMAHSYSHLYGLPTTGLRFFTVYGPWGRPDMALFIFTKAILAGQAITLFNNGEMSRDFTYIDDIVHSIMGLLTKPATPNQEFDNQNPSPSTSWAPYRIFNIGNSEPTSLLSYVRAIEEATGLTAKIEYQPIQPGDVPRTASDTSLLSEWIGFKPQTSVKVGVSRFVNWYKSFYEVPRHL